MTVETSVADLLERRNSNNNEPGPEVSTRDCQRLNGYGTVPSPRRSGNRNVGSPPEDFHNCGKNCGKAQGRKSLTPCNCRVNSRVGLFSPVGRRFPGAKG